VISARQPNCCPISADWLKVRDQIRVQCKGTGVMIKPDRSSGKCRNNCRAIIPARPILPPYLSLRITCADRSSYFTIALMPSCLGGLARHVMHNASGPRSNTIGKAHALHQGGLRNNNFCQHSTQKVPVAAVIIPQQGHRSGKTQSSAGRNKSVAVTILHLSVNARACTRPK
jgi:hypothetical protein